MDTIKKKMLAMKTERDNAMDRAEQLEQSLRDTETSKNEVEEERDNLQKKIMQMEGDLDQVQENLQEATTQLEEAEKQKTQDFSSDEEEMLIVVLDDDDELVVGKSKPQTNQPSTSQQTLRSSPSHKYNNNTRSSPSRNSRKQKQQRNQYSQKTDNESNNKPSQQFYKSPRERPNINTQKLAQRLQNIRMDEEKQAYRAKSPRKDRNTPDRLQNDIPVKMSQSDPQLVIPLDKPHAKIAKPVERRKKKKKVIRPDPEGADLDPSEMDELDKLLNNSEPLFSDFGSDDEKETNTNNGTRRPGFSIAAFAIGLGLNSNTMIKYAIISTELQNIIRVSLKTVRKTQNHSKLLIYKHHQAA